MSLIEDIDYEKTKAELKDKKWRKDNLHGSAEFTWHMRQHIELLEAVLLQYRRANNIFEIGDYVLPISNHSNEVHFLSEWYIDGLDFRYKKNSGGWGVIVKSSMVDSWRHATDKEIAKGFRDE